MTFLFGAVKSVKPENLQSTKITYLDGRPQMLHIRKAHLVKNPGTQSQEEFIFDQAVITIGSNPENDICILDDTVSRYHCRINQVDQVYIIHDLGSTNGTFLNGVRIKEAFLDPGLILAIGDVQIRFNPIDEQIPVMPIMSEEFGGIVARSKKMREIFGILEKVAPTTATVVLEGETGTGKEVVANTIHNLSKRAEKPFIVFDCGAVPESLIESELFGHEKGAFTGANNSRKGLFELADGGTIFLDELGELTYELQPKLLRVLEQREIRRVGGNKSIPVNVRILAATNRKLADEVTAGRFREDLFYRLSVVSLILPPLRERPDDIPLLLRHFLHTKSFNRKADGEERIIKNVTPDALATLAAFDWPGNVRQLLNVVERAVSFAKTDTFTIEDIPQSIKSPDKTKRNKTKIEPKITAVKEPFKSAKEKTIATFEHAYLLRLLTSHQGNITQAAREAEIDRKYFRKLMAKHGIETENL